MKIVAFGANGQTGRLLVRQALDDGHDVVAVTRNPVSFPVSDARLHVVGADVHDASALRSVVDGADAVVSTLGVPMSAHHIDVYSTGATNIVAAMRATGIRRLVVVSSTAVDHYPGRTGTPCALRLIEPLLKKTLGKTTYDDQRRMEAIVGDSGLDVTIVRPSGLFDLSRVTDYVAGQVDPIGAFTSRTDLAHYLVELACQEGPAGTVTISTVVDTPTVWEMFRREAFRSPATQPKNSAASS
jgi:nucleoside-diphosphate-sugar epimerase